VVVLEASDGIGGRVRTDRVDGFTLDRGFQLYNPAYPEGRLAWPGLALQCFSAGVDVVRDGMPRTVADPRRSPLRLRETVRSLRELGALRGVAALGLYGALLGPPGHPRRLPPDRAGRTIGEELRRAGVDEASLDVLIRPFLSGVLADSELAVPRAVVDDILRTFLAGTPGVPPSGMDELPRLLARGLDVRVSTPALSVGAGRVRTPEGELACDDVVVAVDDPAALVSGAEPVRWRGLTTWYFTTTGLPRRYPRLLVSGDVGLANVAVLSDVAPSYAPPGRQLVAASAVGAEGTVAAGERARQEASMLLGVGPGDLDPLAHYPIARALPAVGAGPSAIVASGVIVAGDHRSAPSINGALASGRRAAALLGADAGPPVGSAL
jgi:hypothetical protein